MLSDEAEAPAPAPAPAAPPRRGFWPTTLNEGLQAFGIIAVAACAALAVIQYAQSRTDARVARTLAFVERFSGEAFAPTRAAAETMAAKASQSVETSMADPSLKGLNGTELADLRERIVLASVYGPDGSTWTRPPAALSAIAGFFDGLQACIDREACDRQTAHALLDGYALSFWRDFQPVAQFERAQHRMAFGAGMERYLKAAEAAPVSRDAT